MADKISIYGLSGAGKSCYIYAMTKAMSRGIKFDNGKVLSVVNTDFTQVNLLNARFREMANGTWPPGTNETTNYVYDCSLALEPVSEVSILDYRGGIFSSIDKEGKKEVDELYDSFRNSAALLFFIGADKIAKAIAGDLVAYDDIDVIQSLYGYYRKKNPSDKTPVLIVITKSDLLKPEQLEECKEFLMQSFQAIFGYGTGLTGGLTSVTLGKGLGTGANGELTGQLCIGPTEGNLHVPILFTLFSLFSKRLGVELEKNQSYRELLKNSELELEKEKNKGFFARLLNNNEKKIRNAIFSNKSSLSSSLTELELLNESLDLIKSKLKSGVEIYFNGRLLTL